MNTVKDINELLDFIFDVGDAIKISIDNDSKVSFIDAPNFLKAAMSSTKAIAGINNIPMQLSQMNEEDATAIKSKIKNRFNYTNDENIDIIYENIVIHSMGLSQSLIRLFNKGGVSTS